MPPYDRIQDAAAGKSSTWPAGEPQSVRDAADAKQAEQGRGKFTALRRVLRRLDRWQKPRHIHDYRFDFIDWDVARCWCGEGAPKGTVPS